MVIIGITGPSGAGKSLLCEYLAKGGIAVIDADEVYHGLLIPPSLCLNALRNTFGDEVFWADGTLNRPALSEIVFQDEEKLALLNKTVLDYVLDEIRAIIGRLAQEGHSYVAVDAPTLIESGFHKECDTVISVLCPATLRVDRIMERDHISREKAEERIYAQKDEAFYRSHSDHVLTNMGSADKLTEKIRSLASELHLPLREFEP